MIIRNMLFHSKFFIYTFTRTFPFTLEFTGIWWVLWQWKQRRSICWKALDTAWCPCKVKYCRFPPPPSMILLKYHHVILIQKTCDHLQQDLLHFTSHWNQDENIVRIWPIQTCTLRFMQNCRFIILFSLWCILFILAWVLLDAPNKIGSFLQCP